MSEKHAGRAGADDRNVHWFHARFTMNTAAAAITEPQAMTMAKRNQAVIYQNMTWALMYNFGAIPAAAMGLVAPWLAAIGMSASSLVVVLNALRLTRQ